MKRLLRILTLVLFALSTSQAIATAQRPDIIIVDGQKMRLHTNPLRTFLQDRSDLLPKSDFSVTSNWRGYIATWEISEDELILSRVDVDFNDPAAPAGSYTPLSRNVIDRLFPDARRVVATWYSGALILPGGRLVDHVHMGYGSTHERYLVLAVKHGRVVKRLELDAGEFSAYRKLQFSRFKKTRAYQAALKDTLSGDSVWTQEDAEDFLYQFYSEFYLSSDFESTH